MPVELLVILGAEASILAFVVAMSLHTKRMDVLSGRSFEHPIVPLEGKQASSELARSRGARSAAVHREVGLITLAPPDLFPHPDNWDAAADTSIWPQTPVRSETRAQGTGTPAPGACDRPAVLSEAGRDTGAQGKDAGPEHMQSSAAAILHQLSAP